MLRYLVLVWNPRVDSQAVAASDFEQRLAATGSRWQASLRHPGLLVLTMGVRSRLAMRVVPLADENGVVLGTLFDWPRSNGSDQVPSARTRLDARDSARIAASGGRVLTTAFWGRYVAILHEPEAQRTRVVRDPSGGLPCFTGTFRGVRVFFSRVEDCAQLTGARFTVNWDFIRAQTVAWLIEARDTGLHEVSCVTAGECVEVASQSVSRHAYWNPFLIADTAPISSPNDAVGALRSAAQACVGAWASCYDSILHRLSGGLDSSIVLSCLAARAHRNVACLSYYSEGSDSDERRYGRMAAAHAGYRLIERERCSQVMLERVLQIAPTPNPGHYIGYLTTARISNEIARELKVDVMMSGSGGDQLFYQSGGKLAVADCLRHQAWRVLWSAARDAARMEQHSIWRVLLDAARARLSARQWDPLAELYEHRRIVRPELVESLRRHNRFLHPWFDAGHRIPLGKRRQIHWLSFPMEYYDPLGQADDPERIEPLVSQPLIEVCLRIPTYVLIDGGKDRAIARRAFAADLPREIVQRVAKGGMEEYAKAILTRNIAFVRELLLEGELVKRQYLDRVRLERALSDQPNKVGSAMAEIYTYVSIESWLRLWPAGCQASAA